MCHRGEEGFWGESKRQQTEEDGGGNRRGLAMANGVGVGRARGGRSVRGNAVADWRREEGGCSGGLEELFEGLPRSKSFDTILVVIDKLTKYAHFLCLAHPYTALTVAQTFLNTIFIGYTACGSIIISHRDRIFTSHLWRELFKLVGVDLCMSSAYHPQSDGQTERVN